MIRTIIVLLLIGILISLFSGLFFLFKDNEVEDSKRTLYALGIRVTLAVALVATICYGIYTGELALSAPWHNTAN